MALLDGKTALVTGGAQGLGRAICEAYLGHQMKVCIADVDEETGQSTKCKLQGQYGKDNVMFIKCDVTSEDEFEEAFRQAKSKFGNLDVVVNNAGIGDEKQWSKVIDVNLKGVIRGTLLGHKYLSDKNGLRNGHVINTASFAGICILPEGPSYCASKHGVVAWSRSWGDEINVAKSGIKVNCICPKFINTKMVDNFLLNRANEGATSEYLNYITNSSMSPKFVAQAFIKILEDDVTGHTIVVCPEKGIYYHTPQ